MHGHCWLCSSVVRFRNKHRWTLLNAFRLFIRRTLQKTCELLSDIIRMECKRTVKTLFQFTADFSENPIYSIIIRR